jgi:hypothetical protein
MADVPKTIALAFDAYWREPKMSSQPAEAGIYCVYTCTYNRDAKPKPLMASSPSPRILRRLTRSSRTTSSFTSCCTSATVHMDESSRR